MNHLSLLARHQWFSAQSLGHRAIPDLCLSNSGEIRLARRFGAPPPDCRYWRSSNERETSGHYDGGPPSDPARPMTRLRSVRLLAFLAALLPASWAHADSLVDLKIALARLQAQTPLRATLDVKTMERHGDGADAFDKQGQASVGLEDGARGLQVLYAKDVLTRMEVESRQLVRDPKAKAPTVWALGKLDSSEMVPMTSAAPALTRSIDEAIFKAEKSDSYAGKPARLLTFTVPLAKLSEQQRKYVKEFDSTLSVWIGADGTPLASETHTNLKGRAFVVVSFEAVDDTSATYAVLGDRLVTLRSENHSTSSGAGEKGEQRMVKTLQPQS